MKIISENKSELLKRSEVTAEVTHISKPTPPEAQIKKDLSSLLKKDENLISIKHIYTDYGQGNSKVIANVYETEQDLKRIESKKKTKKKETEKKAEKPTKQQKEQPPKEEKK